MRGSGGRDRALRAEEGQTSPQPRPSHPARGEPPSIPRGAFCKSQGHRTGGVPKGGARLRDPAVMCQQRLSTGSGPRWKEGPLGGRQTLLLPAAHNPAGRQTQKHTRVGSGGGPRGASSRGRRCGCLRWVLRNKQGLARWWGKNGEEARPRSQGARKAHLKNKDFFWKAGMTGLEAPFGNTKVEGGRLAGARARRWGAPELPGGGGGRDEETDSNPQVSS